ncbi:transcription factor bHLH155-like protein [Cucumis melo var. makuwa]|uniref:Transcription factor bHLH155-like protein n=1 Tax=Cucumis melo var. makuwa TaxID=1194695 RepID=A0A5A7TRT8_CUCMM|nr:transcription factor bHLH155-like protein [Cucumis melo var. makuwa]TYK25023.1 transcription factor bHLH155-like protein [Cucumis melo var. makuwa]
METLSLNHLLKSLCTHSQWIYAVFWKIKYQTPPILTWEDGYCNYPKVEKHTGNMEYRMIRGFDHVTSYYGTNIYDGDSGSCSVEPAVADMFCLQYALGEGTVGSAASSGNHSWVFLEDIFTSNLSSASIYEGPTEWIIQYASGIKTILLVPLLPFGVLQLGSLQMVTENLSVVAYIKDRFNDINFVDGACASVVPRPFESLDEQTNFTTYMLEAENHGAIHDIKPPVSTLNQCAIQDVLTVSRRIRPETVHCEKGHKNDIQRTNMEELFAPLYQSVSTGEVEFSDFISLESLLPLGSQLRNHETGLFESNPHVFHSNSVDNVVEQQSGHNLVTKKEYGIADNFFSFPDDCELQKALGPVLLAQKPTNEFSYDPSSTIRDTTSSLFCSRDFKEGDIEYLLEAMITAEDISDDAFSNNTINARIADLVAKPRLSTNTCQSESSTIVVDDLALWNIPESTTTATGRKNLTSLSKSNSLVVNEREEHGRDMAQHRKGMKRSNSSRKIKVTSNTRQRPRDRQLIQDRIKELRQIVPNGGKCSIDGLLEKTIKHMLYLQRVTDQAEKLKQLAQQEDFDSENCTDLENEGVQPNGTSWTWAFDIGSELQVCPIVVEDLEYQGHILIKMLCNDMGLFLEITQIIRGLDLTILKGVIERHSNNSWAYFIVEAPRGFHRMDVFWPLMHLLQRKRNPISCRI